MDPRLLILLTVFTGVAALALLIQMFIFYGLYRSARTTQERLASLADRAEPLIDSTRKMVDQTRQQSHDILSKMQDIAETTRLQVHRLDEVVGEVTVHTRAYLERIDEVAESTAVRFEETVASVQRTVLTPVREVSAVAAAVRAVVGHLGRRRAGVIERATQDEDLFI
jgi:ABC-type transporter Mla subunit MlaD